MDKKVALYCQLGGATDMAEFSILGKYGALENSGLDPEEIDLTFILWKTPQHTYEWLKDHNLKYVEMEYDEGKGFLWNLYKGWNLGYEVGYAVSDLICPIATDHAFYKDWLKNLIDNNHSNRITCCKLIEPGTLPTLHSHRNFGLTLDSEFDGDAFEYFCKKLSKDKVVIDDINGLFHENNGVGGSYGHRLDAMPFVCPRSVWERFGPMLQTVNQFGTTGDTDFFDRCRTGGVEIAKALNAISYHCGGVETRKNQERGIYT